MRIKTNQEREARKRRNKLKRKAQKTDIFKAIRKVVNAQNNLDEMARNSGITEEEMEEMKNADASSEKSNENC